MQLIVEIFKSRVYPTVAKFPLGESDVKPKVPSTKYHGKNVLCACVCVRVFGLLLFNVIFFWSVG